MVYFDDSSNDQLFIEIEDGFSNTDTERVAFFLELSYEKNLEREIHFEIASDLPTDEMRLLRDFCHELQLQWQINLKYPILDREFFSPPSF